MLSDALWPGTSVLQTRARYYLFVPWLFRLTFGQPRQEDMLELLGHCEPGTLPPRIDLRPPRM